MAAAQQTDPIIYGVYDNSQKSLLTRINDFFIDHGKVSLKEKAYFFELFAVMVDAGIPLLKVLQILADKTTNERFRRIIHTIGYHIEHGDNLSSALAKFPMIFTEVEIGVVQSGEMTGSLNIVLSKLSDDINKTLELYLKIRQAMMYPVTIIITLIVSLFIILAVVIPPLQSLFASIHAEVPDTLLFLIAFDTFVQKNLFLLALLIIILLYIFLTYIKTEKGKRWWDGTKLSFPLVKDLLKKIILVRFARALGTLLDNGLPLIKTLKTTALSLGNEVYRSALDRVAVDVQKGGKISESLERQGDLFPEDLTQMIAVGEKTATISTATQKIANQYEREIDHTLKNLTSVIEPLAIVAVGVVVGWFAFVVLGSIFSISEKIG
jgi:type IV pilus assembly protein PilC